ncbi:MAG TPA: ribonuclease R, partial [Candidatus Kapabacteria bacterium]|nr:ribonuclease R [Candidatus Kapabacteria bacterium]
MELESKILALLGRSDYLPLNLSDLAHKLRLPPSHKRELEQLLHTLEHSGQVVRIKGDRYILPREVDLIPGRIRMTRSGRGFLQPDDPALKEIAVSENDTGTALHEDRVLVRRDSRSRRTHREGASESGAVVRILERYRKQLVGTLQRGRDSLFVVPDDPRIPHDVYVPTPRDVGRPANIGDKVVVELLEWESRAMRPEGEIIEVLGAPDAEGVDMLSILRQYNLPLHFPKSALEEARSFGTSISPGDLHGRTDCRHHNVITIDPDDAKDFDDAIYLEPAGDSWRLWVHIADVSHYVKPATALDTEARKRGNSTYLVDRVIPMLPEALSNELCSLKPGVDRLTKAVEFLLAHDGRVLESKFHSAVIHSRRRFTYGEAFAVLQRKPTSDIERMLHHANDLAQKIRRARFRAGALALDFPEMKIRLDERGRVIRIEKVENDISHQLIEEYMLLANEAVAGRLMSLRRPTVYRVHEEPDQTRLDEYREEVLSHNVPCGNLNKRIEIQRLLERLDTLAIGPALKIGFLKSLMRARYAVEPLGHYGLAKKKYTHFTSPIRRYADLVVHRSLFDKTASSFHALSQAAEHISVTERNSADAERDSKDVKLFAFLKAQLKSGQPESYPALVTDLRNFGFFVDVPGLAMSGVVPLSTIEDDFYVFEPHNNQLIGRRSRRIIRLGDKITVQVFKVDSAKKQVDFRLVSDKPAAKPQQSRDRALRHARGQHREAPRPHQRSEPAELRPPAQF